MSVLSAGDLGNNSRGGPRLKLFVKTLGREIASSL